MTPTVNSLSGGKTSSYMALHYPADYDVFALVCIEALYCKPKDTSIVQYVSDKIGRDFIATAESDKTLYVMRDLEQLIGRPITWVAGETFEQVILRKKALPNVIWRFCTTEMKMLPIFNHCQSIAPIVEMRIGFRHDERERAERNKDNTLLKVISGTLPNGRNSWADVTWRTMQFPLIDDRVNHYAVSQWSKSTNLSFPDDSNCVFCFHKEFQQLRKNWDDEPQKMRWAAEIEKTMKRRFKKEMSLTQAKKMGLQLDFFFGTGSGCASGFCTD